MSENIDKELEEIKRLINTERPDMSSCNQLPRTDSSSRTRTASQGAQHKAERKTSRRAPHKKCNWRLVALLAGIVVLLLVLVLALRGCSGGNPFEGTWDMDGTTFYRFDESGTGAMILPSSTYSFSYVVDEENRTVNIDFDDERATDYTYSFELQENKLVLFGSVGKESFSFEFTRLPEE